MESVPLPIEDRLLGFRINDKVAKEVDRISQEQGDSNSSITCRYLLKLGIEAHNVITDDHEIDLEVSNVLSKLPPEKLEKAMELLIERVGQDTVERIRNKRAQKLLEERALAKEEKDHASLAMLPTREKPLDAIHLHNQSIQNIAKLEDQTAKDLSIIRQYKTTLVEKKLDADNQEGTLDRIEKLADVIPDDVVWVMKVREREHRL